MMRGSDRKRFEAILQECIERMAQGATLERCLEAYPEHARELKPLLLTASQLRASFAQSPSEGSRAAGQRQLQQALAGTGRPKASWLRRLNVPLKALAMASALLFAVSLGGLGAAWASADSLPDQPLYPVKRSAEWVRLSLPFQSRDSRAGYSAELAAHRAHELAAMARQRKMKHLEPLAQRMRRDLERTTDLSLAEAKEALEQSQTAAPPQAGAPLHPELRQRLEAMRQRLEQDYRAALTRLEAAGAQAPTELRPRVQAAIEQFNRHYEQALQRIDALLGAPWPPPQNQPFRERPFR